MITNPGQLEQARAACTSLEDALCALRARVEPQNPALFQAMAQSYLASIEQIRREIHHYVGVEAAQMSVAPFWVRLSGARVSHGDVSSKLLAQWLDNTRKTIHNVAYYLENRVIRIPRKTPESFVRLTDPAFLAVLPGSIQIGLRLRRSDAEPDLLSDLPSPSPDLAERALARIIDLVEWSASDPTGLSINSFSDRDEATFVAMQVIRLAPTRRGPVEAVSFSGALIQRSVPLVLNASARSRLMGLASLLGTSTPESAEGYIREIDLDAERITLRERGTGSTDLKCLVPSDLMELAEELLDKFVRVEGTVSSTAPDVMVVTSLQRQQRPDTRR